LNKWFMINMLFQCLSDRKQPVLHLAI